ncbi:MAG TPA: ParA family protein [Inquilinus sp.]
MTDTRVIAIANHKGGAAKTTTAVNLAASLAQDGRPTLLIDLDPQGNASAWLGADAGTAGPSVFDPGHPFGSLVRASSVAGLALLPAVPSLAEAERRLAQDRSAETLLSRLMPRAALAEWRYVIIDTPPARGLLTINALAAADRALVPVEAHIMALTGVVQILGTIRLVQESCNPALSLLGFVVCRFNTRNRHCAEVRERLAAKFPRQVLNTVVRENIRLAEAPSFGVPIAAYAPSSTGAADYRALAAEIVAMP